MAKECPISRTKFNAEAKPVTLGNVLAQPRQFSTGSFGYYASDKQVLTVAGVPVRCQVNVTVTVIGSKDAPEV